LLLIGVEAYSQAGISFTRFNQKTPDWEQLVSQNGFTQDFLENGYQVGINFWVKPLEDYRFEVYPELQGGYTSQEIQSETTTELFQLTNVGFNLNMNLYLLNFLSDCDCPTFSKQESFFEKGFFLQVSPGYHYFRGEYEVASATDLRSNIMNDFVPKLGIGVGVDIGVSDLITLTPMVKYDRYFGAEWDDLRTTITNESSLDTSNNESHINRFTYGLHIGIRWRQ